MNKFKITAALLAVLLYAGTAHAVSGRLGAPYGVDFNYSKTLSKTSAYTVTTSDAGALINGDTTSAGFTVTLPSLASVAQSGQSMAIKVIKTDSSVNVLTIAPATGDTVGGESTRKIINQNGYVVLSSAGGKNWDVAFESPYVVEDHAAGTSNLGTQGYNASIIFEGATADAYETTFGVVDPTADGSLLIPALATGTTQYTMVTALATNIADAANSVTGASNGLLFEGATADAYETTLTPADATADRTLTLPNKSGTIATIQQTYTLDTDNVVLTAADCGQVHAIATDAKTYTLPSTVGIAGCVFTIVNQGASGANIVEVIPGAGDKIWGETRIANGTRLAIAGADAEHFLNTKATALRGDWVVLMADGVDGYGIVGSAGIWAEATP
jgi:hypothetical protein